MLQADLLKIEAINGLLFSFLAALFFAIAHILISGAGSFQRHDRLGLSRSR
jgi:hypothetical protein